jgi:arginyl-tRNA synthetase
MSYYLSTALTGVAGAVQQLLQLDETPVIEVANSKFDADFALPCFKFAKALRQSPQQIAEHVVASLNHPAVAKAEAVAGFVNLWLHDDVVIKALGDIDQNFGKQQLFAGKTVLVEHTDPNPFKEVHIGHAYDNTVGESIARLYELGGAKVHRLSYHGDVGMHIAMSIWGVQQLLAEGEGEWFVSNEQGAKTMSDVDAHGIFGCRVCTRRNSF